MSRFLGITLYEYRMSLRRWGIWLAFGLLTMFYFFTLLAPGDAPASYTKDLLMQEAAFSTFRLNLFMPVIAGIILADRLVRDQKLGVNELQNSTPLGWWQYILGKYFGGLLSILTPVFLGILLLSGGYLILGWPMLILPRMLVAFLVINVPAYAFITAFSLACPLVMPVRVYQILFTGYWFWGNFLNPNVFPTLADTLLTPGGKIAMEGFFGASFGVSNLLAYTATDAILNLVILAGCILAVLVFMRIFLAWQKRKI